MLDALNMNDDNFVLEVRNINLSFDIEKKEKKRVLNDFSLTLRKGEVLALVGESGCGKSTLSKVLTGLLNQESGDVLLNGKFSDYENRADIVARRKNIQMIFQDPYSSIDPMMTMKQVLEEPMTALCPEWDFVKRYTRIKELMELIALDVSYLSKRSHEMSGGQRQRIGVARALSCYPKILICDEPVSALDVSVQAQILNLLKRCMREYDLSVLFISHDMGVVKYIADRVAVMYEGSICELGETQEIFISPKHDYTKTLLDAVPRLRKE